MTYSLKTSLTIFILFILALQSSSTRFLEPEPQVSDNSSQPSPPNFSYPFPLNYFDQTLGENVFYGPWFSLNSTSMPFSYFDNMQGFMGIEIIKAGKGYDRTNFGLTNGFSMLNEYGTDPVQAHRQLLNSMSQVSHPWSLIVKVYDGEYIDGKSVILFYIMNSSATVSFDASNSTINVSNALIDVSFKKEGTNSLPAKICKVNFSLYFLDRSNLKPWISPSFHDRNTLLQYHVQSPDCDFNIFGNVLNSQNYSSESQIRIYVLIMTLLGLITVLGALKLTDSFKRNRQAFKVSLASLWLMSTLDYYLLILNVVLIFMYSWYLVFPSLIYMLITFYVERRMILKLLQIRTRNNQESDTNQDCKSCGFYFIGLSVLFLLQICFIFTSKLWIIDLSALVLVPQIIQNFRKARSYSFNVYHVIIMGMVRLPIIFYIKLYPWNIFRLMPNSLFVAVYTGLMLFQIIILLIQTKFPRLCFSRKRAKEHRLLADDDICSICMGHLSFVSSNESKSPVKQGLPIVETECRHVFHVHCLQKWVKNKVLCPVCRSNIQETVEEIEVSDAGELVQ